MLSNPPFGVEWKKIEKEVRKAADQQGFNGRFGPGLPRVSDGSQLFLLHLISKMRPAKDGGSRFGIVLNGSPLFTGGAGSGESEIRRYVLENDLVEAIIGLPTDMFYNTGISTYVWIVSNRKPAHRKGKLQLIDASGYWQKMRKSLGSKRKELSPDHIEEITRLFGECREAYLDESTGEISSRHIPCAVRRYDKIKPRTFTFCYGTWNVPATATTRSTNHERLQRTVNFGERTGCRATSSASTGGQAIDARRGRHSAIAEP